MPSSEPHLLLTGGTGLIGRRWLPLLLAAHPHRRITVLTRKPDSIEKHARVIPLAGDLRSARLGLSTAEWAALHASVTEIIHCGADIRFNLPLDEAVAVNANGTSALLDLARGAPMFTRFVHISTVYVTGRQEGALNEGPFVNTDGFFNTYQRSKYEAERLVFAAMNDIPTAVFRLSSVIGESDTGRVNQFNYFHRTLRIVPRNPLPIIPAAPQGTVDVIPEDWAVEALSLLYERHFEPGAVYNVCAGPSGAVPVDVFIDQVFARFPGSKRPAMVSLRQFERFVEPLVAKEMAEYGTGIVGSLLHFLPHLGLRQRFENSKTIALLRSEGLDKPDRDFLGRVLDYCMRSNTTSSAHMPIPPSEPVRRYPGPEQELENDPLNPYARVLRTAESPAGGSNCRIEVNEPAIPAQASDQVQIFK